MNFAPRLIWAMCLTLVGLNVPHAGAQTKDNDILQTTERLLTEERRQVQVRRRITTVVRRVDWLLEDLASNGLGEEGGSDSIAKMNDLLSEVESSRIPVATTLLRKARTEIKTAGPQLRAADQEIDLILQQLDEAMQGAGSVLADDVLLTQLRDMIKTEEFLQRQTVEWGKRMLLDPESAEVDKDRIGRAQGDVNQQFTQFLQLLDQTASAFEDPNNRFVRTLAAVEASKPELLITRATEKILSDDPIGAIGEQGQVLETLREAEKLLAGETEPLAQLIAGLQSLIDKQEGLKSEVDEASPQAFQDQQSQFEATQLEIGFELEEIRSNPSTKPNATSQEKAPQLSELTNQLAESLSAANRAVDSAQQELVEGDQSRASTSQRKVVTELEKALATAQELIQTTQFDPFGDEISGKNLDEEGGQGQQDGKGQEPGEGEGRGQGEGQGKGEGKGQGEGEGKGQGEGQGKGQGQGKGKGQPTPFVGDPKDLEESDSSGTTSIESRGSAVKQGRQAGTTLSRRNRSAAIQNYIRQLPPEYRREVADYYEALAE